MNQKEDYVPWKEESPIYFCNTSKIGINKSLRLSIMNKKYAPSIKKLLTIVTKGNNAKTKTCILQNQKTKSIIRRYRDL